MSAATTTMPERRRFTVDEYHRLSEVGVLRADERVELIDGEVIHMSPIGSRHNGIVARLIKHFTKLSDRAIVWAQSSIRMDRYGEPQPDLGLLKPRPDFYEEGNPEPQDIHLLIEVGDSSLTYDLNTKRSYYAGHGVVELWVVDAVRKVIHVYRELRDGEYQEATQKQGEDQIAPLAFPDFVASVREMIGG